MKTRIFTVLAAIAIVLSSLQPSSAFHKRTRFRFPCEESIDCPHSQHCNGRFCVPNSGFSSRR